MEEHLKLAGITRLGVAARHGDLDVFVFDPHRLALPSWFIAVGDGAPATLLTLDRHWDLVPPLNPAEIPDRSAGLEAVDAYTRWKLDVRNVDHILAAVEAGLIGDIVAVARHAPKGAGPMTSWTDRRGKTHAVHILPSMDELLGPAGDEARETLGKAKRVMLDVDLDCFTSLSDADPTEVLPWPQDTVRRFLLPDDGMAFWNNLLPRCVGMTVACEPAHCGGMVKGNRLFEDVCRVLFQEILGADLP